MKKWKCLVCGYIHEGDKPPEICPVCGADKSKFVLLEEVSDAPAALKASVDQPFDSTAIGPAPSVMSQIASRFRWLSRLHGHPIAVHIPNGVLPLTVFFLLLAVIFKSEAMATAAKINTIAVALFMPAVIISGIIDWHNRYNGKMSLVFRVKVVCAAIVTLLSFILALWWVTSPDLYLANNSYLAIFVLLNLADLIAAALAGFYGGKLVFNAPKF